MANSIALIIDDLKHSWYFRIWMLLWIGAAIAGFGALIFFGNYATNMQHEQTIRDYTVEKSTQTFPDFEFRLHWNQTSDYIISGATCKIGLISTRFQWSNVFMTLATEPCAANQQFGPGECHLIKGSNIKVTNTSQGIYCNVTLAAKPGKPELNDTTRQLGLSIPKERWHEGYVSWVTGGHELVATNLKKHIFNTKGGEIIFDKTTNVYTHWRDNFQGPNQNQFFWFIRFSDLNELHTISDEDTYPRMFSAADIGGFGFLVYCPHKIIMFFVGLIFTNNSAFLNGSGSTSERVSYANL